MSAARGATAPEPARWADVAIAIAAGLLAGAHVGKMPPALPAVRADLDLDLVTAGWVVSVFAATGAAFGAAAGGVADRLGHRVMLVGGLVLLAAGDFLGALAP